MALIKPYYTGSYKLRLQEVLHYSGLRFDVSSNLLGVDIDRNRLTLEEFLIKLSIPQIVTKSLHIKISDLPTAQLQVTTLYAEKDVLYINVLGQDVDCHYVDISNGLNIYRVSDISYVEVNGQWWKH